jgi:hypothetical protein
LVVRVSACCCRRTDEVAQQRYWIEPGSSDCQPRLELCELPPEDASPPPMWIGVSSELLLVELDVWLLLEELLELLWPPCGIFRVSPLLEELSWLELCTAA